VWLAVSAFWIFLVPDEFRVVEIAYVFILFGGISGQGSMLFATAIIYCSLKQE
jgi:hypothetical protein